MSDVGFKGFKMRPISEFCFHHEYDVDRNMGMWDIYLNLRFGDTGLCINAYIWNNSIRHRWFMRTLDSIADYLYSKDVK